jgi:iron complex transport system ATP-binding protein
VTVQVSQLSYRIKTGQALVDGVDLDIPSGQVTCVLGPNGAGKTTLLRLLSCELAPASGSISLNGRNLKEYSAEERALRIAVLPQSSHLSFPYPVIDVVLLGRLPHRRHSSSSKDQQIAFEALEKVEATHLVKRSYSTLSGGEKQRVQLARILAQLDDGDDLTGKLLLLDEPTSALDLAHQHQVLHAALGLASRGAAVFSVLHDLNLAAQ